MIYESTVARLLHELERPGTDAWDHGTPFANEVQRMVDELDSQRDELLDTHEELSSIVSMCRHALAAGGELDVPSWPPALVRACLEAWRPGVLDDWRHEGD